MDVWHKETTPGTTGSRCTIRDENGLFVAECIASDASRIVEAPAMVEALGKLHDAADNFAEHGKERHFQELRAAMDNAAAILSRIDGAGDALPDAPAMCPDCENSGVCEEHPFRAPTPTGELVTVRADHLSALVEAAGKYAADLETGLEDGTYEDRADLDAVKAAIAAVQGEA